MSAWSRRQLHEQMQLRFRYSVKIFAKIKDRPVFGKRQQSSYYLNISFVSDICHIFSSVITCDIYTVISADLS